MVDRYTVWVGGVEVNNFLMPEKEAIELANLYRKLRYTDVHIEKYHNLTPQLESISGKSLTKTTCQSIISILSSG